MKLLLSVLSVFILKHVDCGPIPGDKAALGEKLFIRTLGYMTSNPETLEEMMSDDQALSEGDVLLSSDRNAAGTRWPTNVVPYVISPDLAGQTGNILSALSMVSEHTCLTFDQRTTETSYLLFRTSKGCASYVGFQGGEQPVFIGPTCIVGNIAHEVLHALGLHHEHTRMDRERYITILTHNIMTGMERNFQKQQGKTFSLPYDITSIMHYGSGFFSVNGLPTIVPKSDVVEMGQRVKMTLMDVERLRQLYNCDATNNSTLNEGGDVDSNIQNQSLNVSSVNDVQQFTNKPE